MLVCCVREIKCVFLYMPILLLSIESIFATKCNTCILCTSDVWCSREQNIPDLNKCSLL